MVARLETGSASARSTAELRLSQSKPQDVWDHLLPLIERTSAPAEARAAGIRVVSKSQGDLGLPGAVMRVTGDANPVVRREALAAIVAWGNQEQLLTLRQRAAAAEDPAVRADLEQAGKELIMRQRDWWKQRMVSDPDPLERVQAVRWLGEVGKEEDVPVLIAVLKETTDDLMRQELILAISGIGGEEAKVFVRTLLAHPIAIVRGSAAIGESDLRDPDALGDLEGLLAADPVIDIRVSSANALGALGTPAAAEALARACAKGKSPEVALACNRAREKFVAPKP